MIESNVQARLEELVRRFRAALAASSLAAGLRGLADAEARSARGRPLTPAEIAGLEAQGNAASDWSRVRLAVAAGADAGLGAVRGNLFAGDVLLEGFRGACLDPDGRAWPAGLFHCRVRDAVVGNAHLYRVADLDRQIVGDGAVVADAGEISCPAPTRFGLGSALHPGAETGGRSLWMWDGLSVDDAALALSLPPDAQRAFQAEVDAALGAVAARFGLIGAGACVRHARRLRAAYIGPGSRVEGASLIDGSALLSAPDRPAVAADDAWIEASLLLPGARIESGGRVSHALLLGGSAVAWGGMASQSVLGPGTHVQKGEVTASLLGPFVGFHHQSLLISALWPEGRGNIAYGANVGSNHTGKKPDQEIRPGEGNFFGLGCSIKFPADYADAPYSLIAAGVSAAPQRVAYPFSLINGPQGDAGAGAADAIRGLNEIVPGWMWSDNAFSLARRIYKFESGGSADPGSDPASTWKTGFFAGRIFAGGIARKVLRAYQALRSAPPRAYYLEEALAGLGRNYMRAAVRDKALSAYEDYLAFFLLRAYADRPGQAWDRDLSRLVALLRAALAADASGLPDARSWADSQRARLPGFLAAATASLARDDKRGRQVFDDYADFHPPAAGDPTLARLAGDLDELDRRLAVFIGG